MPLSFLSCPQYCIAFVYTRIFNNKWMDFVFLPHNSCVFRSQIEQTKEESSSRLVSFCACSKGHAPQGCETDLKSTKPSRAPLIMDLRILHDAD